MDLHINQGLRLLLKNQIMATLGLFPHDSKYLVQRGATLMGHELSLHLTTASATLYCFPTEAKYEVSFMLSVLW